MSTTKPIRRVTIIGTGVIGASWAALYLAKGLEVVATDIAPDAEAALKTVITAACPHEAGYRCGMARPEEIGPCTWCITVQIVVHAEDRGGGGRCGSRSGKWP